jgi:hypothetical protein
LLKRGKRRHGKHIALKRWFGEDHVAISGYSKVPLKMRGRRMLDL